MPLEEAFEKAVAALDQLSTTLSESVLTASDETQDSLVRGRDQLALQEIRELRDELVRAGLLSETAEDVKQAIIVAGNLSDGFSFIGPYEDWDEAALASERLETDSWIATLDSTSVLTA